MLRAVLGGRAGTDLERAELALDDGQETAAREGLDRWRL